ncbi:MAG: type II toxin-antitoxin system HicA family toxin [Prochloron sp. SP5CPC1]|nr:type II toxin-antitoxin system HicA family toxin [Candidatus Paraprochloron terpiosi SP5CPC1]
MPRLKRLSGLEVIKILEKFGFQVHSQRGSHIKMRRITEMGKETLTIPNHQQLNTGTCRGIFRQASQYISPSILSKYFYRGERLVGKVLWLWYKNLVKFILPTLRLKN